MIAPWTTTSPSASTATRWPAGSSPRPTASPIPPSWWPPPASSSCWQASRFIASPISRSPCIRNSPARAMSGGAARACKSASARMATTRTRNTETIRCQSSSSSRRPFASGYSKSSRRRRSCKELKSEGATDYVALPLIFSTGHVDALSVVSDHPDGFSMTDLDRMFLLQFAFTRIVETHSLRDTAVNLLERLCRPRGRPADPGRRGQARRWADHRSGDLVLRPARLHARLRHPAARHDHRPAQRLFRHHGHHRHRRRRRDPEVHGRRHAGDLRRCRTATKRAETAPTRVAGRRLGRPMPCWC